MKALLFANQLHGFKAVSIDGPIGHVDEFYFDDQSWRIRYCVVDIGSWISDRKVLISPAAISGLDWHDKGVIIKATKDQIQKSPAASAELPVARVLEAQIHQHYGIEVNQSKPGRILLNTSLVQNIDVSTRKIQVASPWRQK